MQHVGDMPLASKMTQEYIDGDRRQADHSSDSESMSGREWEPTSTWALGWKSRLPLQTIMRLLQVILKIFKNILN